MLREVARTRYVPPHIIRTKREGASGTSPETGSDTAQQPKTSDDNQAETPSRLKTNIEASTALGATTYAFNPLWGPTPEEKPSAFTTSSAKASESYQLTPELKLDIHGAAGNTYFFNAWESSISNIGAGSELSVKSPQLRLGDGHTLNASASAGYDVTYFNYNPTDTTLIREVNVKAGASYTNEDSGTTGKLSGGFVRRDGDPELLAANFTLLSYRADVSQSLGNGWAVSGGFGQRYFNFEDHPRADVIHDVSLGIEKTVKIEETAADGTKATAGTIQFSGAVGRQWRDTNMPGTNLPGDPNGPGDTVHGREFERLNFSAGVKVSY